MSRPSLDFPVEIVQSKTDHPVPVINGIYLHSKSNPIKEAEGFVLQNNESLSKSENVLLFGLGFAYHLNPLENKMKALYDQDYSIYVIEPRQDIYQECLNRNLFRPSPRTKVFCRNSLSDYFQDKILIDFMSKRPTVIAHPASLGLHESFFKRFMAYQSPANLAEIIKFVENNDLKNYLKKYPGSDTLDTIFERAHTPQCTLSPQDLLLLALKEISQISNKAGI